VSESRRRWRDPRIPYDMRIALRKSRVLGRVKARIHAGQDCESPCRWKGEFRLRAEVSGVTSIGIENLVENLTHDILLFWALVGN